MSANAILLPLMTALIGAVIGTFLGAYFIKRMNNNKINGIVNLI